ncbi:DUF2793 domain-containing protein [Sphingobium limneticum]|uniref:DUF2793 domain-containing protein n=1 Tax=Sphingobium limneticum TaxID=1007511 RepID=A0A5J5I3Q7_9SPHN|nr:DUF2793 domain-containing protein [Sphingobium limneticum]KAA9018251.1 DUF2793 domain-containing protein [Sphingobium limneticum]KAA9030887.1 DUF2793 domain-containing protein [Sphingobium limneticum]
MDGTARWALPLLFAGQAQKEITHNEALVLIDALLHARVESADLASPPGTPLVGQCWIVADGATGDWAGKMGAIALWTEGGWRFVPPRAGLCVAVADRDHRVFHEGTEWRAGTIRQDGVYLNEDKVVGARMAAIAGPVGGGVIDVEARSVVADILAALRGHGLIAA